ncbi:unnamed protein product [Adineta ricciae]|uniref:K Homology domain-containing protein n=1 Tax=Adineta ricciae TaxID=249248 RepID=A0A815XWZ2_ADIRI|nr:unnamed protein product [Adineta ricciae]
MSNSNTANPPLFNNNKSLYGTRTQTNQSSKKISIIEDKATLEPVRPFSSSLNASSTHPNSSFQRNVSSELSSSQLHKQIQIQKQALNSINLDQMHQNVYHQLDEWKNMMYNRVDSMKSRMLEENAQSHNQLISLQSVMQSLLEEEIIKQLLLLKANPQLINDQELDGIEQRLERAEIEFMKRCDVQLDSSNTQIVGDIQLYKMTDFSKHQPLPQPPPSPPPPTMSSQLSTTITDEKELDQTPTASELAASKPIPPVWTDATRQGLNSLSHYLPFRLLIPNNVREKLIDSFDIEHFDSELALSCESPIESILTIINQDDLDVSVEILNDLMVAFQCSSSQYELRLLYPKKFIPIITGKRNERLDRLKDKYQLDMMKVFPQACPLSDERVILLRCQHADYMIYCLREVIQNVLEQGHFDSEDQSYAMYDPSENYDESSAHEYGGYKSNDICEVPLADNNNDDASVEDLTETKQRTTASAHSSSSSSLTKYRHNSEDIPLNYDDTEPESDDDDDDNDDSKRSQSSEDKRIFVKKLNTVKGRQVGLLIGPFGQHITQIREQTGAKIHLTNDDNEPSVIKGTKSQINQALRLIRECLQTQKPIPRTAFKGGRRR